MRFVRTLIAILLSAACLAGCGGANNINVIEGQFQGTASDGTTVVAFDARPSVDGTHRTLNVFATDGASESEFFTGTVTGNLFTLESDTNDAQIEGTIDSLGVTANLSFNAGPTVAVSANAVAGAAGLYTVTLTMPSGSTPGSFTGTSSFGSQLAGAISATQTGNSFEVSGTATPAGATAQDVSGFVTSDSSGQQHWIVTNSLAILGAGVTGSGNGFASPNAS